MPKIVLQNFDGEIPIIDPRFLQDNQAQSLTNGEVVEGVLKPIKNISLTHTIPKAGAISSIFKLDTSWLGWVEDVDVVQSFIADNVDRIYYTDGTLPKKTNLTLATAGAESSWPTTAYRLGVPKPSTTLNAQLNGTGTGSVLTSTYYVYTYITGWGEESEPSDPSGLVEIETGHTSVTLTNFTNYGGGDADITNYRIYRLNTGSTGVSEYQFVKEVAAGTTTTDDTILDSSLLGELLLTEGWDEPPADLKGIMEISGSSYVGFTTNEVYFSEPGYPFAWPSSYALSTQHTIVGLGKRGNAVIVLTDETPYEIVVDDPAQAIMRPLEYQQPCTSKNGIVSTEYGVIYPSSNGLFIIDYERGTLLTKGLYTEEQWKSLDINNLIAFYYDNKYIGFWKDTAEGFWIDLGREYRVKKIDLGTKLVRNGVIADTNLELLINDSGTYSAYEWEGSATSLQYTFTSKIFTNLIPLNYTTIRVIADGGTVVQVFTDEEGLVHNGVADANTVHRLAAAKPSLETTVSLLGTSKVSSCVLATSPLELAI